MPWDVTKLQNIHHKRVRHSGENYSWHYELWELESHYISGLPWSFCSPNIIESIVLKLEERARAVSKLGLVESDERWVLHRQPFVWNLQGVHRIPETMEEIRVLQMIVPMNSGETLSGCIVSVKSVSSVLANALAHFTLSKPCLS